jgi:hypothetical protein
MLRAGVWVLAINLRSVGLGYAGMNTWMLLIPQQACTNDSFLNYSHTELLPEVACNMPANPATPTLHHQPPTQCRVTMP